MFFVLYCRTKAGSASSPSAYDSLESGKWTDFIVVNDNPLADINNMRSIDAVYIAGNRVPDET